MRFEVIEESACRRLLRLEVPQEEVVREREQAARSLGRRVSLPGFRKGRVPAGVIRARFADEVEEKTVEALAERHVPGALERHGLRPVARPVLKKWEAAAGDSLRLEVAFEVEAPLALGEYRGLEAVREPVLVTEADVEAALESLRQGLARLRPVEERGAARGDEVSFDLQAEHIQGPEAGQSFARQGLRVDLGGEDMHPQMTAAIEGARSGEERQVVIAYPEDYRTPALAGRTLSYRLRVGAVRERQVPPLDDAAARELGDFTGLEDLRRRVREDLESGRRRRGEEHVRQQLVRQLLERHPFEVPPTLVENEVRHRLADLARELGARGIDPAGSGVDWRREADRLTQVVGDDLRTARVLDAVAGREGIEAREEDVASFFEAEGRRSGRGAPAVRALWEKEGRIAALRAHLRRERVLDFLIGVGHIQKREA